MNFNHSEEHLEENMLIIQANIDDMNPELCSYIADILFGKGANDVYWIPIIMKKGRPGIMLNVLISHDLCPVMEEIIFKETTTLGLRHIQASCHRLGRKYVKVATQWGEISIKLGFYKGELVHYAPEYSQCAELAKNYKIPLKIVYDQARAVYIEQSKNDDDGGH